VRRFLVGLCVLVLCGAAAAQNEGGFGQNKVQYRPFDWKYVRTEHFDIYYYKGGEQIAEFAARNVEKMYVEVAATTGHKLTERVPILLHNTHTDFQQTNVIPMALPEGVGGFTERFKNRIVLPFEGSYRDFYHVLQHEMTHAVIFNMLFQGPMGGPTARQMSGFPLWVNEGLAEYASIGWDLGSEFFLIDATTFGYVASPASDFGGFLAYKGGQSFFNFLETVYGKGTTKKFIANLAASNDMGDAFRRTTRTSLEEAGEIWLRELRRLYWPELGQRQYGKTVARRLTHRGRDHSFYNLQPSISPDGEEIAFFSDRETWEAVYILNVKTEKVTRAVIQSGNAGEHESFRSFKSGIAWSPDGKSLAVVSKRGGRDVIHLLNAKNGKVERVLSPDVVAILSPDWSRDGKHIAFSGQKDGFTDVYVVDLDDPRPDAARRLTADVATDDRPVFSPSGKWIVFESDRPSATFGGRDPVAAYDSLLRFRDLYRMPAEGGSLERVSGGPWDEKMPSFGASDSQFVFVSNRSGLDNIYLWTEGKSEKPVTNLLTGCFTPSWSRDGKKLAFSLFEAGGWDVYLMNDPLAKARDTVLPKTRFILNAEDSTAGFFRAPVWENLTSFKADSLDSARRAQEKAEKASRKKAKKEAKLGAADSPDSLKAADSTRADSLKTKADTTGLDSAGTRAKDGLKSPPPDTSRVSSSGVASDSAKARGADSATADSTQRGKKEKKPKKSPFLSDSAQYIGPDGAFIRRPYSPKWSFDAVNAAVGVDNYYGTGGLAFLTLSDLMGDQRIAFALSINGSLENTNGYVEYAWLPWRVDLTAMAFQESQSTAYFVYGRDSANSLFGADGIDRRYGFGLGARYPFSPFTRVEGGLFTRFTERTRTITPFVVVGDTAYVPGTPVTERIRVDAMLPSVAWVHDNAQWGIVGPVAGRRLMAGLQYLPPVFQDSMSYVKAEADARFYKELNKRYTFALRVSGGLSEAVGGKANPHQYYVGGESYTFNAHANYDHLPDNLAQFYFSDLDFPLRGYDVFDFRGTRKFVTNAEFRFPFIQELTFGWPVPFSITDVMGNLFADYGGAWSSGDPFKQMGLGLGYGWRLNLGIFVLKYSRAWPVAGPVGARAGARSYWSLGSEF
jgi:Tol biopolymer transport system component